MTTVIPASALGPTAQPVVCAPEPRVILPEFYNALFAALGQQGWWPACTRFEVIVGAILTQNTAWGNVERAIANLRRARMLSPRALERVSLARLARLVRPSGYFRQKARKLKTFVRFLRTEYRGSLARMFRAPTPGLRQKLLSVPGIGPETADSILLYAGGRPVFVVDAYTRRILSRHGLIDERSNYEQMRALFEQSLPRDSRLYNEYHALLVQVGKNWCRPGKARCDACPLGRFLSPELRPFGPQAGQSARGAPFDGVYPKALSKPGWGTQGRQGTQDRRGGGEVRR
jgi:endonuclease-3 related protein